MSDWKEHRDESVQKAIVKIETGLMIMNSHQLAGLTHILSIVWMDGSISALRGRVEDLEQAQDNE